MKHKTMYTMSSDVLVKANNEVFKLKGIDTLSRRVSRAPKEHPADFVQTLLAKSGTTNKTLKL